VKNLPKLDLGFGIEHDARQPTSPVFLATNALLARHDLRPSVTSHIPDCWLGLVDEFFAELHQIGQNWRLVQIKEKFGGLRVYITGEMSGDMQSRVRVAESSSWLVCDVCGSVDCLRGRRSENGLGTSRLATRCDEHAGGAPPFQQGNYP
jgi:hypothetical protein